MGTYVLRKLLSVIPVLLAVSVLVFCLRAAIPGDVVDAMFRGHVFDQETVERLRQRLGLDQPLPVQYVRYMAGVIQGDLGTSVRTGRPVVVEIGERLPRTLVLTASALLLAALWGTLTGIAAATKKDSIWDTAVMVLALAGVSTPSFLLGLLLMSLFAVRWGVLPVMGSGSPQHVVLPALTLGLISSGIIARMTRATMAEVLKLDYIRTARAKGLPERVTIFKHALRNAAIPTLTIIGLQFGFLLGGAFVVEIVFSYNGIGDLALRAIRTRDFTVNQGIVLVVAAMNVLVNLVVDLCYAAIDPRVAYD